MAADAAVPRLEPVAAFASPVSTAAKQRAGRTDYSDRLSREISRGNHRPRPVDSATERPASAASGPRHAERSGSPVVERPIGIKRNTDSSSESPPPESVSADRDRADAVGKPHPGSGKVASPEQTDVGTVGEAGAEGSTVEVIEVDLADASTPSVGMPPQAEIPPPPWSSDDSAPPDAGAAESSVAGRAEAQAPAAIAELLLGSDPGPESSETIQSPEADIEATPVGPRGFATSVLPAEEDASAGTRSSGMERQIIPTAVSEPAVLTRGDADANSIEQAVVEPAGSGNLTSVDSSAEVAAEQDAVPPQIFGPSDDVAQDPAPPLPGRAAVPNSDASEAPAERPKAESTPSAGSAVPTPAGTVLELSPTPLKAGRADAAGVSQAGGISGPPAEGAGEPAAPLSESSSLPGSESADPGPAPSPLRYAETNRAQRLGSDTIAARAAAGNEIAGHAASALRAADILDRPIKIRLTPPELGALHVEVSRRDGKVSAQFEVTTTAAHAALNDQLSTLRESLGRAGVIVDRIEVRLAEPTREEGRSEDDREGQGQRRQTSDDEGRRQDDRRSSAIGEAEEGGRENGGRAASRPSAKPTESWVRTNVTDEIDIQV